MYKDLFCQISAFTTFRFPEYLKSSIFRFINILSTSCKFLYKKVILRRAFVGHKIQLSATFKLSLCLLEKFVFCFFWGKQLLRYIRIEVARHIDNTDANFPQLTSDMLSGRT